LLGGAAIREVVDDERGEEGLVGKGALDAFSMLREGVKLSIPSKTLAGFKTLT